MPTITKTKTKTAAINRRTNTKKRKHRSWIWWVLFLVPIAISIWLFAEPVLYETKKALRITTIVEESKHEPSAVRTPERIRHQPREMSEEGGSNGVLGEGTKEDIDWALGHMYKLLPIVISLIAILKKGAIMGRSK